MYFYIFNDTIMFFMSNIYKTAVRRPYNENYRAMLAVEFMQYFCITHHL